MKVEKSTEKDFAVFKKWSAFDRLEELTCRPVVNGKRVLRSNDTEVLSFFTDDNSSPAGRFIYFDMNERNKSCEFGYLIDPGQRNKGLGKKMLRTCIDYLFNTHDLNKIYCQTASFNTPSIKLLESMRFHRDAVLREHHELDGKMFDDYVYSLLRTEWAERKIIN